VSGPKYQQIADAVLAKIASGEIDGEITLGRIRDLTGATDSTSRKAANELVSAGILESHPGAPYTVRVTAEGAAAARLDDRPLKDQVAELRQEVDDLRERIGRMDARLATVAGKPRGGNREQAKAAAGGGRQ
jgi:DNA-binding transcriptional regulator YhcF (GntR family)